MRKRSLYDCIHAIVNDDIFCAKGHLLGNGKEYISINRLIRGEPLEYSICQNCPDFEESDDGPIPREERGWIDLVKV